MSTKVHTELLPSRTMDSTGNAWANARILLFLRVLLCFQSICATVASCCPPAEKWQMPKHWTARRSERFRATSCQQFTRPRGELAGPSKTFYRRGWCATPACGVADETDLVLPVSWELLRVGWVLFRDV